MGRTPDEKTSPRKGEGDNGKDDPRVSALGEGMRRQSLEEAEPRARPRKARSDSKDSRLETSPDKTHNNSDDLAENDLHQDLNESGVFSETVLSDTDLEEVAVRRKSSAQRDENHILRQRQIQEYTSAVLKEERDRRSKLRHGFSDESPKKRKRVGFLDPGPMLPSGND